MRLQTTYKKKKSKTVKKTTTKQGKKSKGPKLLRNYKDDSHYIYDNLELDICQMRYGIIGSCNVEYLILPDGTIELKGSWIEALLIMIDTVITNNPTTFRQLFEKNGVTSQTFSIDTTYGKYNFEGLDYKAYKIYNSGYYLEAIFSDENIFEALVGLIKCLDMALTDVKFHIKNKYNKEQDLNFTELEDTEAVVGIHEVENYVNRGIHLVGVDIVGSMTRIHRLDVALLAICNWVYESYGTDGLKKLVRQSNECKTGISRQGALIEKEAMPIKDSGYCVYTDLSTHSICEFISFLMNKLNIGNDKLRFKFRALKKSNELHEWELD